jgi:hypothetical protein
MVTESELCMQLCNLKWKICRQSNDSNIKPKNQEETVLRSYLSAAISRTPARSRDILRTADSTNSMTVGELAPTLEHRADFSVSWSFTDGRTPWTGDQLVARPLPKHRTTQTQKNAHIHIKYP